METRTFTRGRGRDRIRVVISPTPTGQSLTQITLFADEVQSNGQELRLIQYREGDPGVGEMTGAQYPELIREYDREAMGWQRWQILL